MIEGTGTSKNIIDRRDASITHAIMAVVGFLCGAAGVHWAAAPHDKDADLVQLTSTALDRGQDFWHSTMPGWHDAKVVLFTNKIDTPCGEANPMTGPFYCPSDEHIYIDLAFLRSIKGDLGRAYVIAHELGHHVQKLAHGLDGGFEVELQADCYAGEWMRNELLTGHVSKMEIGAAYNEAASIADLGPRETWTHGDADHRIKAITQGYTTGACR